MCGYCMTHTSAVRVQYFLSGFCKITYYANYKANNK